MLKVSLAITRAVSCRGWRRPDRTPKTMLTTICARDKGGQGVLRSLAEVCLGPGGRRRLRGQACAERAEQVPVLLGVLDHLGPGRRFGAEAPHRQRGAGRAGPRGQGPLPAAGGPVPGPDGGLGHHRGGSGYPCEGPGGPDPVHGQKKQLQLHPALLLSRAIPALSPRRRECAKLPGCRYPDAAARRGQGASTQVRRWRRAGGTGFQGAGGAKGKLTEAQAAELEEVLARKGFLAKPRPGPGT